jgi:LPXTG-site transpeptidase (sortase) family protein
MPALPDNVGTAMQRRFAATLVAIGLILLVVLPAMWQLTRPESVLGDVAAIEESLRDTDSAVLPAETPEAPDEAADTTDDDMVEGETPSSIAPADPVPTGPPVGLRIDTIEVDARIAPYGVDRRTGDMDVPDNVSEVAWYKFGPRPGENGSAVLAAHVDLASQGPGVFFDLSTLEPGDRVAVEYEGGEELVFRVTARVVYEKTDLPLDVIFSREGPSVLTLITCGGGFNRQVQSYDSNVVVYAVPDDGSVAPNQS